MNISSLAIKNPIQTIVLFVVLCVMGIIGFYKLPINAEPNVNFPIVNVTVTQNGASPDELENSVTRYVENAVAGMANVRHVTSTITDGQSLTEIEFSLETDLDRAVNDVRNTISAIRDELPKSVDTPNVERMDADGGAILYFSISSPNMTDTELTYFIDDTVVKDLLTVDGVQKVTRLGGSKREIRVEPYPEQLIAYDVSLTQLNDALIASNVNIPAGRRNINSLEHNIRVLGSATSIEALKDSILYLQNGKHIKLSDIANVIDSQEEIRSITKFNGENVLGFSINRAKGYSDTIVAAGVFEKIAEISAEYGVAINPIYSSVENTKENYDVAISTLLEGAILTILVVFLFLRSWRATLVAAISLPISILPAFFVMWLFDYTLNSITLLAITLVIGILVDDAIVEIENIEGHLSLGKRPYKAALDASDAIGFAVVAISLCIVAVFLPISFIPGMTGMFFSQFGITVCAAVLSSLLVARCATPLLAAYILMPHKNNHLNDVNKDDNANKDSKFVTTYLSILKLALNHRKTMIVLGVVAFVGSLYLLPLLPTAFEPKGDNGMSQVSFTLVPGTTLETSDKVITKVQKQITDLDEVDFVYAIIGGEDVSKGELMIQLKPHNQRDISKDEFEDKLRDILSQEADIRFAFQNDMASRDLSITIIGNDPKALMESAKLLKKEMQTLTSVANVQINAPLLKPELQVTLEQDEAAKRGINAQNLGDVIRIATVGDTDNNSAKFSLPDRQIPIRVRLSEKYRDDFEILANLKVVSSDGELVAIQDVAELNYALGSVSLSRFDRTRKISVDADLSNGATVGQALDDVAKLEAYNNLPSGIKIPETGDSENISEMFESFGSAMMLGVGLVLVVLILLFKDFLQPLTIFVALPLSIGGALLGLLAWGAALDLSSVIGILMLMAIVSKNSILLVDFIIEARAQGMSRYEALLNAGRKRARAIIMTTIAMVAGMLPAVFASGYGAAFRAPMAIAVICGLLTSTLLSLIFVPVVYSLVDDVKAWILPKLAKLTSVTAEDRKI